MFRAKLKETTQFKRIVECIKDFTTIVNFNVMPDGISIQSLDQIRVVMIIVQMDQSGFMEYEVDFPLILGINVSNLYTIMQLATNEDNMIMSAYDNPDHLYITFENQFDNATTTFKLYLYNQETDQFSVDDIDECTYIRMPSSKFSQVVLNFQKFSDTGLSSFSHSIVFIETSENKIIFSASGDMGKWTVQIEENDSVTIKNGGDHSKMQFLLRFLSFFIKASCLNKQINIYISNEHPLLIEYIIEDFGYIKYYLAPKIVD